MDILLGGQYWTVEELKELKGKGLDQIREEIASLEAEMNEDINLEAPVTTKMIALLTVLSLFTVVGSVGNGLVLFVFSRVRDKTTAQLFILALALIDLFTCMVIIPFTMFVEYTRYDIKYDFLCKLYQFLITSKVPLSAFIMVAIAFDRYFCICHPLRKIITPWRTKVIIVSLTLFASILGVMTSLAYGVYQMFNPDNIEVYNGMLNSNLTPGPESIKDWSKLGEDPITKNDVTMQVERRLKDCLIRRNFTSVAPQGKSVKETFYIGICAPNEILLDWSFVSVYQKCYTALFLICLVIVGVLYGMIYRFIGMRRNKKLQQKLVLCAHVNGENGCGETGTRTTVLNANGHDNHDDDDDKSACNTLGLGAGGVYIGGCSTSPPLGKKVNSNLVPSFSPSSSFHGDTESGKSNKEKQTKQSGDEPTRTKSCNSRSEMDALKGDNVTETSVATNAANPSIQTAENNREGERVNVGRKMQQRLPSPTSIANKEQEANSDQERYHPLMDHPKAGNNRQVPFFCKRRTSSSLKRIRDCHSNCKREINDQKRRRDSEPIKYGHCGVIPSRSFGAIHQPLGDLLTVGSRVHFLGHPDTLAEEYIMLHETGCCRLGHSEVGTELSEVCELNTDDTVSASSPLVSDREEEILGVADQVCDKTGTKQANESEVDDPVVPLLQEPEQEKAQPKHSLTPTSIPRHPEPEVPLPTCREDFDNSVLASSSLNNRCAQSTNSQQVPLTSYVRNLVPDRSSSSLPLCARRDVSHHSLVDGAVARSPSHEIACRAFTGPTRRSPTESGAGRKLPVPARKKRWQNFRCKKASTKGSHNSKLHHKAASYLVDVSGRRSTPQDAEKLRDENRAANARTALMLFTVTLVFVVAFLPAWLMAHRILPTQLMVFYLYFTYNVANPFIYAFMNVIFKDHLKKIFRFRRGR